eukprot:645444-Pyramimonas_sp.AAC.1
MTIIHEFLEDDGTAQRVKRDRLFAKYPESLSRTVLGRWIKASEAFHWAALPVKVAKVRKEVPNWFKEVLGLTKKGRDPGHFLPITLQAVWAEIRHSEQPLVPNHPVLGPRFEETAPRVLLPSRPPPPPPSSSSLHLLSACLCFGAPLLCVLRH